MPGALTAGQLSFLQTKATGTLDLTANTTRNTGTGVDQYGNPTETWTAVLTGVACGMSDPGPAMQQLYPEAFIGSIRTDKFSLPIGSDVKRGDRITASGRTYRVQVRLDPSSYSLLVQCIATQINEVFD